MTPGTSESKRLRSKYDIRAEVNGAVYELWERRLETVEKGLKALVKERDYWRAKYDELARRMHEQQRVEE